MELKVDIPSLAGQNVDPETFQRVWDRVMPNQTGPRAREDASPSIPDTSVPAEPSLPPTQVPPADTPSDLPPVPTCAADTTPDLPAVPDCPAQPDCPACPECPTCPDTPGPAPEAPALCLGEASQGDSQRLEALMVLARERAAVGQTLARRTSGACARTLSSLARGHRLALRRLSAAYFLITGKRYVPKCSAPSLPSSLALALRQQFGWEQQWEQKNSQAAQATSDPCLKELYSELAQEGAFHAGCIRSILEQMT